MNRRVLSWFLVLILTNFALADVGYVHLQRDRNDTPVALKTAILRLQSPQGQIVDLVGVIHVGEKEYYHRLNKHFGNYDSVLYEMVLDVPKNFTHQNYVRDILGREKKEPKIDTSKGGRDSLSLFQRKLAEVLELDIQLEHIDYQADNFRHADLTLGEFEKAMAKRRPTPLQLLRDFFVSNDANTPTEYKAISKLPLVKILAQGPDAKEREILRVGVAAYLAQEDDIATDAQGEVLIGMRNKRAIQILKKRLLKGDKKIAIFYGAAHLPDFTERIKEMGFKTVSKSWLQSWDLTH